MAAITWQGDESTNWETGGNWSGGSKPTAADDVTFDNTASGSCVLNAASVCQSITITNTYADSFDTNGQTLTVSGSASLDSDGTGDLVIDALVTLDADGDFSIGAWNSVDCTSGSLDLQGKIGRAHV